MATEKDVIEALELPETAQVTRHAVKPGDVIVIECDRAFSMDALQRITEYAAQIWPDNKIGIFTQGLHVKVMGNDADGD